MKFLEVPKNLVEDLGYMYIYDPILVKDSGYMNRRHIAEDSGV